MLVRLIQNAARLWCTRSLTVEGTLTLLKIRVIAVRVIRG